MRGRQGGSDPSGFHRQNPRRTVAAPNHRYGLFHRAVAERLGHGPTDLKCLDLMRELGPIAASDLVAITGLTSGAITGVVARLERVGYLYRESDPDDGRRQVLHVAPGQIEKLQRVFEPIGKDATSLLERFNGEQLEAIAEFLEQMAKLASRHATLLRVDSVLPAHEEEQARN